MKVPYFWLQELVKLKSDLKTLSHKLSLTTIGVDKIEDTPFGPVLDLDVTYNRGDLLSMVGVAREVAFIDQTQLTLPDTKFDLDQVPPSSYQIKKDDNVCSLYVAVILQIKPTTSPDWLQKKLRSVNLKPQNLIVDLTNYVMWEWGQPFHAFDLNTIEGSLIQIKPAGQKIQFITLDGKTRTLDPNDILIWDAKKPIALAGVMGGQNSQITNQTTTILLEMALFNPFQIRRTAMRHGLFSDAANRFIHQPAPQTSLLALKRILKLFTQIGSAQIKGITINGNFKKPQPTIALTLNDVNQLLGTNLNSDQIITTLSRLDFKVVTKNHTLTITPPFYRQDIKIKADVIEEVARGVGYHTLNPQPLPLNFLSHKPTYPESLANQIKDFLTGQGLYQLNLFGFYNQFQLQHFNIQTQSLIQVTNPISNQTKYLKSHLAPGLYEYFITNQPKNYFNQPLKFFEINRVYLLNEKHQPIEKTHLGLITDTHLDLAQILSNLFTYLRLPFKDFKLNNQLPKPFHLTQNYTHLHTLYYQNRPFGFILTTAKTSIAELDWYQLLKLISTTPSPSSPTNFAPVIEDLTFSFTASSQPLFNLIIKLTHLDPLIVDLKIIDLYKNKFTLRCLYNSPTRQLTSQDVTPVRQHLITTAHQAGYQLIGQLKP